MESEAEEDEAREAYQKDKSKKKKGGLMGKINEMNEKAKNRFDDEEGESLQTMMKSRKKSLFQL